MENITEVDAQIISGMDTSYLLLTGMNILFMQLGFTALEAGGSRAKHVKSVLFKNLMDHSAGALAWFTIGWGLYLGNDPFAAGTGSSFFVHPISQYPKLFQQFAFAATASTIVSGAVTGRCRLEAYVVLSVFMAGISYPIAAHWAWADFGWLKTLGFLDFAGSTVVHGFGGAVAFVCAWLCGPRPGRYIVKLKGSDSSNPTATELSHHPGGLAELSHHFNGSAELSHHFGGVAASEAGASITTTGMPVTKVQTRCCVVRGRGLFPVYKTRVMPKGHNPPLMVVGALFLYVAWFSFNAGSSGSTFSGEDDAARAAVNTLLAAGAAALASMVFTLLARVKYDIEFACNSMLAGLVAITAPCAYIDPWAAVVVGILACPVYIISAWFVLKVLGVDDVLGAVSVHGSAGILGTVWLGFTHPEFGLFYGAGPKFLGVQALGAIAITSFSGMSSFLCVLLPFRLIRQLNYTESEQLIGIDFIHFGGEFGKDVDLESDVPRRNSMHSNQDDLESDAKSGNSNFIEEFPPGAHGPSSSDAPVVNAIHSTASITVGGSNAGVDANRPVRSSSQVTFDGRRGLQFELRRVLEEDPRMRHRFRAYLEVMHKDEGVRFWDAVAKWKNISAKKQPDKKVREAKKIIRTYCLESGIKQVNLASKMVRHFNQILEDKDELLKQTLFDAALEELFKDLRHDFAEFVNNTPSYWV